MPTCACLCSGMEFMSSFGEKMQREREMRNISLDEIAESTKIGSRMLRALEQEDFDKLPGGIFNKGFVRAYAKFLGLDEEQAVADFQAAFAEKQQQHMPNGIGTGLTETEVLPSLAATSVADRLMQSDQAAVFLKAAVLLIFVLGVGGFGWKYVMGKSASNAQPQVGAAATSSQTEAAPVKQPANSEDKSKSSVTAETVKTKPAEVKSSAANVSNPLSSDASTEASPVDLTAAGNVSKISLQIHATQESWVQITADGKVLISEVLSPSTHKSFRATKEMVVKLGNAGGVELSYNGKPLPQFPPEMKSRTLTFTPFGLQQ